MIHKNGIVGFRLIQERRGPALEVVFEKTQHIIINDLKRHMDIGRAGETESRRERGEKR